MIGYTCTEQKVRKLEHHIRKLEMPQNRFRIASILKFELPGGSEKAIRKFFPCHLVGFNESKIHELSVPCSFCFLNFATKRLDFLGIRTHITAASPAGRSYIYYALTVRPAGIRCTQTSTISSDMEFSLSLSLLSPSLPNVKLIIPCERTVSEDTKDEISNSIIHTKYIRPS